MKMYLRQLLLSASFMFASSILLTACSELDACADQPSSNCKANTTDSANQGGSSASGGAANDANQSSHDQSGSSDDSQAGEVVDGGDASVSDSENGTPAQEGSSNNSDSSDDSENTADNHNSDQSQCQYGSSVTNWGGTCGVAATQCVPGTWVAASTGENGAPLRLESDHFSLYWKDGTNITEAAAQSALAKLEHIWDVYFGETVRFQEPYCDSAKKLKATVHFDNDYPLWGGSWAREGDHYMGMWVGPGAALDAWGLAHEFTHGIQALTPGFKECGGVACWIYESHANFMAHQVYPDNFHCSEMFANSTHLHYGNTRNRYCNWQFFEFLKDRYCIDMVNEMWTAIAATGQGDPWQKLMQTQGWDIEKLNDVFGEWALHNVIWDYQNPDGTNKGAQFRSAYSALNVDPANHTERRLRLTQLEPLDDQWSQNRRFASPFYWAPQRWGYNIVRLYPEEGETEVKISFQGVEQVEAHSGWRWGLVATNPAMTTARYSDIKSGSDEELVFCISEGEELYLVVLAAPTEYQKITWEQPSDGTAYPGIYRYPYLIELDGAWPQGFDQGARASCPAGTINHQNGGGCAPANTPSSVYVGPYAKILGGTVTGNARIEDHATVVNGQVTGGTVGALSLVGVSSNTSHWGDAAFTISDDAVVKTTFYPLGWFIENGSVSGTAKVLGDAEYRSSNKSYNIFYGMVTDSWDGVTYAEEVTVAPPYQWQP